MWIRLLSTIVFLISATYGHEPLFGLGPHTIGQYSWAVESEMEKEGSQLANQIELLYGVFPDLAVTIVVPYILENEQQNSGLGAIVLRGKYRFWRRDQRGSSTALALHAGMRLRRSSLVAVSAPQAFLGLSFGYESRRHYAFADIRGNFYENNENLPFVFFEAAYGIRPWLLEYKQPDLVVLVEILQAFRQTPFTSGTNVSQLSIAPGFLFSVRNIMLKGGIKLPLKPSSLEKIFILGIEIHMPPFK